MTRFILIASLVCACNAIETGECVLGSEASCGGSDSSVLLQGRLRVNEDGTQMTLGACSADSDVNCCFTSAGVEAARSKIGASAKIKAGDCAAGSKLVAGDQWATLLAGLETCKDNACADEAIPTSGTCAGYTCPEGWKQRSTGYLADAQCTNVATCEFNCCEELINADPNRRNGVLLYATLWTVVNVSRISNQVGFHGGGADDNTLTHGFWTNKDLEALHDNSEGLRDVMINIDAANAGTCPPQSADGDFTHLTHIKACVDAALCVIASNVMTEEDIKSLTMLREYYGKFEDITWDKLWGQLNEEKMTQEDVSDAAKSPFGNKDIDFQDAAELACVGVTAFVDELDGSATFAQMDSKATAYRASVALVDAARTTHALLDSHQQNSSVDATIEALQRAWEPPCKLLNCDHTNYWDLLGASHAHSIALIESGASAHHMQVHLRTRGRLEIRMQRFLAGANGREFASRIYRTEGTSTEAQLNRYMTLLLDTVRQRMTNHPKKYGLDSTVLSLYDRDHMQKFFKTPVQARLLQAFWDKKIYIVENEEQLNQLAQLQALTLKSQEEELSDEEEVKLESLIHKHLIFKAIAGFVSDVGSAVVSAAEAVAEVAVDIGKGIATVATAVGNGIVEVGKAIGEGIVTGITAYGEALITIYTAIGKAIVAFVDFVIDILSCLGAGTCSIIGYGKKFPCPFFFGPCPAPPLPCPQPPCPATLGVALTIAVTLGSALKDLLKGIVVDTVGISIGVVIGLVPGGASTGGARVGLGIALGVACKAGNCKIEISVGAVAAVVLPIAYSPRCVLGQSVWGFGCGEGLGLVLKLLCCFLNLTTGCQGCGKGGCEEDTVADAPTQEEIEAAVAAAESCDETITGNGADYRGCQTRTKGGLECQKWSVQYPHKWNPAVAYSANQQRGLGNHNMCRNPNGNTEPWCMTKDPAKRWDHCSPKDTGSGGVPMNSGWVGHGGEYGGTTYVNINGLCIISGFAKNGNNWGNLGDLPESCRPKRRLVRSCNNHNKQARVDVQTSGRISWHAGGQGHNWISLSGIAFATKDQIAIHVRNGWIGLGGVYGGSATYGAAYAIMNNNCMVEGLVKHGHSWGHLSTLPAQCRPNKRMVFNLNNHARAARVDVQTNGVVSWHAGGQQHHWMSLTGIQFALSGQHNLSPGPGWAHFGGSYGNAQYSVNSGICTVSGLLKQGSNWGHLATLAAACRPKKRLIFSMNNHAYSARVDVRTDGIISWHAGSKDHTWISLSGIMFDV